MYNVYSDDKVIRFAGAAEDCGDTGGSLIVCPPDTDGTAKVLEKLGNNKSVCVKCGDPYRVFADFRNGLTQVDAAGGLVRNSRGDSLMIFRNGRWDLPKGHLDPYEECTECALREVKEECGLENLTLGGFLCKTYHVYHHGGRWIIKETRWYSMRSDDVRLTPQTGEGIEKAEWVAAGDVEQRLMAGYPMIAEVFAAAEKQGFK